MPADSRTLEDEGVVIEPQVLDDDAIASLSEQMRQPEQRRADLRAQLAAGRVASRRAWQSCTSASAQSTSPRRSRRCSTTRNDGRAHACEELEDGTRSARDVLEAREGDLEIVLEATVDGDELTLDFTGTADQHDGNLNCPMAVTRSACYFAIRVLTDPDIPPSAGAYRP